MTSPLTPLGQYFCFLMSAAAYTPNPNKAVIPFDPQKPLSSKTHLPVEKGWLTHSYHEANSLPQLLLFLLTKFSWPDLDLHDMCFPKNGGESATNGMPLIDKGMWFMDDTHKSRSPLVEPLHNGLIKNIDPWWLKLLSHILVPSFLQFAHL